MVQITIPYARLNPAMFASALAVLALAALPDRLLVTLPSGSTIRIVAVSNASGRVWAPDGGELDPAERSQLGLEETSSARSDQVTRLVHFEIKPAGLGDFGFECKPLRETITSRTGFGYESSSSLGSACRGYLFMSPCEGDELNLDLGIAETPYDTIAAGRSTNGRFRPTIGADLKARVTQVKPHVDVINRRKVRIPQFEFRCNLPTFSAANFQSRYRLFDANGKPFRDQLRQMEDPMGPIIDRFEGLAKNVASYQFQVRPYLWARFRGIRLAPTKERAVSGATNAPSL